MSFKVGDTVVCVDPGMQPGLQGGREYTVEDCVEKAGDNALIKLEGVNPLFYEDRFKLVEPRMEGIPEGYTFVRIGTPVDGEMILNIDGKVLNAGRGLSYKNYVIVTPEKPKTRKILLKEWIVWDVEGEERTAWSVIRPNRFNQRDRKLVSPVPWVNAVETGVTREMEVPC